MDILRNLFGHLTSGIIRLAVTVGVIAAVGYFLVKPALETTKELSREANQSFQQSFGEAGQVSIAEQIEDVNKRVQRECGAPSARPSRAATPTPRSCCAASNGRRGT